MDPRTPKIANGRCGGGRESANQSDNPSQLHEQHLASTVSFGDNDKEDSISDRSKSSNSDSAVAGGSSSAQSDGGLIFETPPDDVRRCFALLVNQLLPEEKALGKNNIITGKR